MLDRAQEFQEVRRLLRFPKPGRPSPDSIVSALLRQEQVMTNRQNLSGKGWTPASTTFVTVADTAEYSVLPSASSSIGKALYVYRDLGNNDILPVPHADFSHELSDQKYEFWLAPFTAAGAWPYSGEKVAFFRDGAVHKARVYPVPTEVRTYTVVYAAGWRDWTTFDWPDAPALPEFSFLKCLRTAAAELTACEWEGRDHGENRTFRQEIGAELGAQIAEQEPEFEAYLRNPQHEPISFIRDWDC